MKLTIGLPYDSAFPLLGVYTEKIKSLSQKQTFTFLFPTALVTIAKTWQQPQHPPQIIGYRKRGT